MSIVRTGFDTRKGQAEGFQSEPFLVAVPDFIQADWQIAGPRSRLLDRQGNPKRGRSRIGEGLRWAIHQAVIMQKSSRVVIADVLLAQILWGPDNAHWCRNWRRCLVQRLKGASKGPNSGLIDVIHREVEQANSTCPAVCALHGIRVRHQHLEIVIKTPEDMQPAGEGHEDAVAEFGSGFLGALEVFGEDDYPDRNYYWSPGPTLPTAEDGAEETDIAAYKQLLASIKRLKRQGSLGAVYFPLKLFGPSPRVGLGYQQRQLHQAITRELTRGKGKTQATRPDRAEIVLGGDIERSAVGSIATCPYLLSGSRHVSFNGNGKRHKQHLHGRGYRLHVWMRKAAYMITKDQKEHWRQVRKFLQDLGKLSELFGLVIAAWHPKECAWRCLADMARMVRTPAGRFWLRGCLLRVYTEEDYLVRWRQFFARQMGFAVIPDTDREQEVISADPLGTLATFLTYLNQKGVSAAELAQELGVSRSLVSRHLSGQRGWTTAWTNRLAEWLRGRKES